MTKLEQAARQALDALEAGSDVAPIFWGETVDALRAALAQQAEPVTQLVAVEKWPVCSICLGSNWEMFLLEKKPQPTEGNPSF
jgi:hypothetical protein